MSAPTNLTHAQAIEEISKLFQSWACEGLGDTAFSKQMAEILSRVSTEAPTPSKLDKECTRDFNLAYAGTFDERREALARIRARLEEALAQLEAFERAVRDEEAISNSKLPAWVCPGFCGHDACHGVKKFLAELIDRIAARKEQG